jgi:hypothetical protein
MRCLRVSVAVHQSESYTPPDIAEKVAPDHAILRQISSLVSTLPTIDAPEFRQELTTVRLIPFCAMNHSVPHPPTTRMRS